MREEVEKSNSKLRIGLGAQFLIFGWVGLINMINCRPKKLISWSHSLSMKQMRGSGGLCQWLGLSDSSHNSAALILQARYMSSGCHGRSIYLIIHSLSYRQRVINDSQEHRGAVLVWSTSTVSDCLQVCHTWSSKVSRCWQHKNNPVCSFIFWAS